MEMMFICIDFQLNKKERPAAGRQPWNVLLLYWGLAAAIGAAWYASVLYLSPGVTVQLQPGSTGLRPGSGVRLIGG